MKRVTTILFAAVVSVVSVPVALADIFLKLPGIDGESTAVGHEKWIDISSFQFGVANPGAGSGGGGKPVFSEVTISKAFDASSPPLMEAVVDGKSFANALVDFVRPSQGKPQTYLKYEFSDVFLTSYSVSSGGDRPFESLSFAWSKLTTTYFPQSPTGGLGAPVIATIAAVPEPSTWAMLAGGLLFVGIQIGRARRMRG